MREVITYVSYDGTEFNSRQNCYEYEEYAMDMMRQLIDCYQFDTDTISLPVTIYEDDISVTINDFEEAFSKSRYVNVKKNPPTSAISFIYNECGIIELPEEIGRYRYDFNMTKWEKVVEAE